MPGNGSGSDRALSGTAKRFFDITNPDPTCLGLQVRAALAISSVSNWNIIPAGVLISCIHKQVISPAQAMLLVPPPVFDEEREGVLAALYPHVPEPYAGAIRDELGIRTIEALLQEQRELLSFTPSPQIPLAEGSQRLADLSGQEADYKWGNAFYELARVLPDELIPEAIHLYQSKNSDLDGNFIPTEMLLRLPEEVLQDVLNISQRFYHDHNPRQSYEGFQMLEILAPRIPASQLARILDMFRFTSLTWFDGFRLVYDLPNHLLDALLNTLEDESANTHEQELVKSIRKVQEIRQEKQEANALAQPSIPALTPAGDTSSIQTSFYASHSAASELINPLERAIELAKLADQIPPVHRFGILTEACQAYLQVENLKLFEQNRCAHFIQSQAPHFGWPGVEFALRLVRKFDRLEGGYPGWTVPILFLALAPNLPETRQFDLFLEAIDCTREEPSYFIRSYSLARLAQELPPRTAYPLLEIIWELDNPYNDYGVYQNITFSLQALLEHWSEICAAGAIDEYHALTRTLHFLASAPRWVLEDTLPSLMPHINRLGGDQAAFDTVIAVLETRQAWE